MHDSSDFPSDRFRYAFAVNACHRAAESGRQRIETFRKLIE
jgi:hypothetical protein